MTEGRVSAFAGIRTSQGSSSAPASRVPQVRYLMQSLLRSRHSGADARLAAVTTVLDWVRSKWGMVIPKSAWDGVGFDYEQPGLRIAAAASEDGAFWAFRSEHLGEDSRTWATEAIVADDTGGNILGVRNSCSSLRNESVPSNSPRILREFVAKYGLIDDERQVRATPWQVSSEEQFEEFFAHLLSPGRSLPVVVLSPLATVGGFAIDPGPLSRNVQGLAHVVCLEEIAASELTARVGRTHGVFNGGVRTYAPGFNYSSDPARHQLVLPSRIEDWRSENEVADGPEGFSAFLARQIHLASVRSPIALEAFPSYTTVRRKLLDRPGKTSADEMELLRLERDDAQRAASESTALFEESAAELASVEDELRSIRAQNMALAAEVRTLRESKGVAPITVPDSYGEMVDWVYRNYSDRLVLHPRAVKGIKTARFEDVGLVYGSLKLLATDYWAMRCNEDSSRRDELSARWEDGLAALKLEYNAQSISETRLGEFREKYTIDYRIGMQHKVVLGPHLKYGSTKDDRFCMRVYFLWDDQRQLVVVGSLPAHLDTRAS